MDVLTLIIFCIFAGAFMYSGGRNPIEYYKSEQERKRILKERDHFIDEMFAQGNRHNRQRTRTKRETNYSIAKDIFLRSEPWRLIRQDVFRIHGKQCLKCGNTFGIEVDHIKPVYKYPSLRLDLNNLQPLCGECNSVKGLRTEDYRKRKQTLPIDNSGNPSARGKRESSSPERVEPAAPKRVFRDKPSTVERGSGYTRKQDSVIYRQDESYLNGRREYYSSLSERELDDIWKSQRESGSSTYEEGSIELREWEMLRLAVRKSKGYE